MGADMLIAVTKMPVHIDQADPVNRPSFVQDHDLIRKRAAQSDYVTAAREILLEDEACRYGSLVPEHVVDQLHEGIEGLIPRDEHGAPEFSPEDFDWSTVFTDDQVVEVVMEAVADIVPGGRDVAHMVIGESWYIVSGGLSHGDSPTEACDNIWFISELGLFDDPFPKS